MRQVEDVIGGSPKCRYLMPVYDEGRVCLSCSRAPGSWQFHCTSGLSAAISTIMKDPVPFAGFPKHGGGYIQ